MFPICKRIFQAQPDDDQGDASPKPTRTRPMKNLAGGSGTNRMALESVAMPFPSPRLPFNGSWAFSLAFQAVFRSKPLLRPHGGTSKIPARFFRVALSFKL